MDTVESDLETGEEYGQLVADFLTAFVAGDGAAIGEVITDDCVIHQVRWPLDTAGREAIVADTNGRAGAFTDVEIDVESVVAEGDRVAVYTTARGRNVGALAVGDREVAPTGNSFEIPQFAHYRIENGRIAESWVLADALGLVEQLDNLPAGPLKMLTIMLRQVRWRLGGKRDIE